MAFTAIYLLKYEPWRLKGDGLILPVHQILLQRFWSCNSPKRKLLKFYISVMGISHQVQRVFLQTNLDTVRRDVVTMYSEFFMTWEFVAGLNSIFLGLFLRKHMQRILGTTSQQIWLVAFICNFQRCHLQLERCHSLIGDLIFDNQNAFFFFLV